MHPATRHKYLRLALLVFGLVLFFGAYPLMHFWASGWGWGEMPGYLLNSPQAAAHWSGMSPSPKMIIAVYMVLGIFLIIASINPRPYFSLISFTIWSSFAHGGIMAWMAFADLGHHWGHLFGDIPGLLIIGAVLAYLCPQAFKLQFGDDEAQVSKTISGEYA